MTQDELRNIVAHIVIGFARKDEAESGINSAKPFVLKATWDSSSGEYSIADYDSTALRTAVNGGRVALLKFDNGNMADYTLVHVNSNGVSDTFGGVSDGTLFSANLSSLYGTVAIAIYDVSDIDVIRSGAALGATAYQKPNGGIPKGDLSSTVQSSLSKADSALQSHQDLSSYATGAEYDSASKRIYLKHGSTRLTGAYVDATAFIKDGMVDNVTISSGYLVITFNTDSGKEPISLALTDIFNASNYYTKTEIDQAGYLTQESDPTVPSHVKSITQANITSWNGKQDAIGDLADIRSGASKGATAPQQYFIDVQCDSSYQLVSIDKRNSDIKQAYLEGKEIFAIVSTQNNRSNSITLPLVNAAQPLRDEYIFYFSAPCNESPNTLDYGLVLTVPEISEDITLQRVKYNKSAYISPRGGIPKTDLSSDVQSSLDKADTALQSFTESDPTVPAWAKASSKPTYTAAEVGALPSTTSIPTKTSDLTNDSNFVVDADYVHTDSNYTAAEKSKLSGISAGAEANVQSDWSLTETTSDAFIKNKPTIPSKTSDLTNDSGFVTGCKVYYGTCTTAAATDPKVCTVEEFPLDGNGKPLVGTQICVKFSATDTSTTTTPHLNVNGTGTERIWVNSAALASAKSAYHGYANRYITYMWDGTYWVWRTSGYDANTTYTNVALGHGYATQNNSSAATAITAALGSYALTANGIVSVHFNYDVPANATLNVNGKGAKAIYHRGAAIAAGVIKAGDTATFVFSTYYHLISVDRDESADLTNYYTKTEIDTKIGDIETLLASI